MLAWRPPVYVRWRVRGLNSREWLKNAVGMDGAFGNNPGVTGLQHQLLPLEVQLGATVDHVAHGLIIAL